VVTSTSEESTLKKKTDKNSKDLIADVADVSKRHHPVKNLFTIIHARAVPSEKMYYNLG
jgi:hypothetical protein